MALVCVCSMCGRTFPAVRLDAVWCSVACRVKAHRGEWHPRVEARPKAAAADLAEVARLAPLLAWARQVGGHVEFRLCDEKGVDYMVEHPGTVEGLEAALANWAAEDWLERWAEEAPEEVRQRHLVESVQG